MAMQRESVLVTGGAGFIGANLTQRLLKEYSSIHLIVKKTTNLWRIREIQRSLTIHTVSLLNPQDLTRLCKRVRPSVIFHLATYGSNSYQNAVRSMVQVNIQATLNLLLALQEIPYKAFINTGTSSEYGFKKTPMRESDLLEPYSLYAATKAAATHIACAFAKMYRKPIITLRPFSVYGPYEDERRFVHTIIQRLLAGKPIQLTPGLPRRDFVFVEDLVEAYMNASERGKTLTGQIINLGTGKQYTNGQVVETLFKVTKKRVPVAKGAYPKRLWDTSFWVADASLAKKLLGWKPRYSLEQGLRKTYQWYYERFNPEF